MDRVHADRREPAEPDQPLALDAAAKDLLAEAAEQSSGRAARSLTPGAGAPLKQTMIAITEGNQLDEHVAPGAATIHVLSGSLSVEWDDGRLDMTGGQWATLPTALHRVQAHSDSVALVTTAPDT